MGGIVGILLAAGSGSRFGSDKLLHLLADGTPLALAAARGLLGACDRVVAVLRPGSEALAEHLAALGCTLVVAPEASLGMGHSLAAGVRASAEAGGWLVGLADMPGIAAPTYQGVAAALRRGHAIAAPVYQGRRGHPVGFASVWYAQLSELQGDTGARAILARWPEQVHLLPVTDAGVLLDVDRPADLLPRV